MLHARAPAVRSAAGQRQVIWRSKTHTDKLRTFVKCASAPSASIASSRALRVRYLRKDQNYKGWGLHIWGDVLQETDWANPLKPSGEEDGAVYFDIEVRPGSPKVGLLVHKGEDKSAGGEMVEVDDSKEEVWLVANSWTAQWDRPDLSSVSPGALDKSYAHWVTKDEIVWRMPTANGDSKPRQFALHYSKKAHLWVSGDGVQNAETVIPLEIVSDSISPAVMKRFPHLYGCSTLRVPNKHHGQIPELLKGQLAVTCSSSSGDLLVVTATQLQGVLDDMFTYDGPLGDHKDGFMGGHKLSVWAPTAQKVELLHWTQARGGDPAVIPMTEKQGVWSAPRPELGTFYKYRVTVYSPLSLRIEVSEATDPYSRATTANGERTIIVDLDSPDLAPAGWKAHRAPALKSWLDQTIYELHVRDFSACDPTVPEEYRGKYRAFCPQYVGQTLGLQHLATLQEAGLNTIHLLPSYDFGSVPERAEEQRAIQEDLSNLPPDSDRPQAALAQVCDQDAYNWGYDPVNYGVPEGSYSTDPDSTRRVLEYREMVEGLHKQGFRVVLDVVYNHTFSAGPQDKHSVLDKIVPGYYHRRSEDGDICHSTCCNNTASEHAMCERLVIDDITHWARTYKVDGFRFDIMGHMMISTLAKIRDSLDSLTLQKDGVDGRAMYLYGEGWDFGEVAFNQRGRNAGQLNLAGTGLGSFNERLRDPCMGGNPFSALSKQGFITGLATDPNGDPGQSPAEQVAELLHITDHLRYAMAGNLREYEMELADGRVEKGGRVPLYASQPVAYGAHPWENVPFIGCHDNETIFDKITMKAPFDLDARGRARMCMMAMAMVAYSQGVPFFHAGDELLRSKSLDRDSYNSGDWFNRIDWSGQDNNFGVGLPPASKNEATWDFKRPLLAAADRLRPTPEIIAAAAQYFRTVLRVRASSVLFRLPSAEDVCRQVKFHNTGPSQVPGVVVMEICSAEALGSSGTTDPQFKRVVVVANASPRLQTLPSPPGASQLILHPMLRELEDPETLECKAESGMLFVPGRTTAVFVQLR